MTNSVFVNGSSSVIPEKSNYCQCDRGFEKHEPNESCKPKGTPIINAEIDFELNTFESNQPNFKKKVLELLLLKRFNCNFFILD